MIRKIIPWIALGLALGGAYFAFDWAVGAVIHYRRVVMVPDLSGKSVADALNLLGPSRLGLAKEGEQYDKRYPAGTIVRQTPRSGMMAREGRIVRITLSQGGETLFIPDLLGQPLRNAQTALQNVGLSLGEMERRPSLRFEKNQVMSTDPPAGTVVSKNVLVSLVVSDGPPVGDVLLTPDFVGQNVSEARNWAAARQVVFSTREENDLGRAPGEVTMQSPTPDSPIRPGDTLTVVVNTASETAVVPPGGGVRIYYEVPQGSSDRDVKILVIDEAGEREVFRRAQSPGSRIDLTVQPKGRARARIFVNAIMVEEQSLQ